MSSANLERFLSVALNLQSAPWEGIRVVDGMFLAANGVQLVAWNAGVEFVFGNGMLPRVTAAVIKEYAAATSIRRVVVDGNAARIELQMRAAFDGQVVPGEYATLALPSFPLRAFPVELMLERFKPPSARLLAIDPKLRTVREAKAKDFLALVEEPKDGSELFVFAREEDEYYYNPRQLQEVLALFPSRARLIFWINSEKWLIVRDGFDHIAAIAPFRKI